MKIEIQDKNFWIQQCSLAIHNIQEERQRKQKEWEGSSWWHRFTKDEPMKDDGKISLPWNWGGEWDCKHFKELLELPCCGYLEINPHEIDLRYILSWARRTKENTTDVQGTSGEQSEQEE